MKYNVAITDGYKNKVVIESSVTTFDGVVALLENFTRIRLGAVPEQFEHLKHKGSVQIMGAKLGGPLYRLDISKIERTAVEEPELYITLWHRVSLEEFLHEMPMSRRDVTAALVEYVEAPMDKINEKLNKLIDGGGGYVHFLSFDFPDGAYSATVQMKG